MSRTASFAWALSAVAALVGVAASAHADDPSPSASPAPASPVDLQNAICPVKGKPIATGVTETVNGTVVHFCCTGCAAKYRADPGAYRAALRADPAVAKRLDEADGGRGPLVVPASADVPLGKGAAFHDAMRVLFADHVLWTRLFLVSAAADLPDREATTARLLRNQEDIGNAVKPYYGDEAGTKLTALLKEHITTAADLVAASTSKDAAKADAAKAKWYANADDIASFLSAANPATWPLDDVKSMMREHLDATISEVTARLRADWDADVAAFEKVQEQAVRMADMLSDGIRRQFPEKFT